MYLAFVERINPELIARDEFVANYFSSFVKGLGQEHFQFMQWEEFGTFDRVIRALETTIRFSNSALDTSPGNTELNGGDYLSHFKKHIWIRAMAQVVRRVRQMRPAVGL